MSKHYNGDDGDLKLLMGAVTEAYGGMAVDDYTESVSAFMSEARHPTLDRPYRNCAFAPMVELLRYLEAAGFATYIASGGDRDFMRPIASALYAIPPERVIGSSFALSYRDDDEGGAVVYKHGIEFFDDGPAKPVRIWSRTGRRPVFACGNSNGDIPMLRFAGAADGLALRLLIRHDDDEREVAYDAGAEDALGAGFTVVSIRDDWTTVFGD